MKNKLQKAKANNKGFTLVELIVVIAILGVLMAVLVPQYIQYVEKSRIGVDESIFGEIAHNMEIGAASTEALGTGTYTATITLPKTAGTAITYDIAATATDPAAVAAATQLGSDVKAVIPPAKAIIKSKLYSGKTTEAFTKVTITMIDGQVTRNGDKLFTAAKV